MINIKLTAKKMINRIINVVDSAKIYMLHHVTTEGIVCSCTIEKENFEHFIEQNKNKFISMNDMLNGKYKDIKDKATLTFDDGLWDLYQIAYPYLIERNIPFTAFIAPALLDTEGYITIEQLIEMSKNPLVTIGGHTDNHVKLTELTKDVIKSEIISCKKKIESIISKPIELFAYPFGLKNKFCIKALKKFGFRYAFTTMEFSYGHWFRPMKYLQPRINVIDDLITSKQNNDN